jgi:hypothetical protein
MTVATERRRPPRALVLAALALVGWSPGACQRRVPAPAAPAPPCAEVRGPLSASARAEALAGDFRLTLVATQGARAGHATSGWLHLRPGAAGPIPPAGVRQPLHGGAELALDSVGAVAPGDIGVRDAARPGVLVLEWRRPESPGQPEITLRFGADANRGGAPRFDGSHLALSPLVITADGFAGRWDSGVSEQRAEGHFCAVRMAPEG